MLSLLSWIILLTPFLPAHCAQSESDYLGIYCHRSSLPLAIFAIFTIHFAIILLPFLHFAIRNSEVDQPSTTPQHSHMMQYCKPVERTPTSVQPSNRLVSLSFSNHPTG